MGISQFTNTKVNFVSQNISAQIDGNTINYAVKPFVLRTLMVFWNGIRQSDSEITITSNSTFSTSFVASAGDSLIVTYFKL